MAALDAKRRREVAKLGGIARAARLNKEDRRRIAALGGAARNRSPRVLALPKERLDDGPDFGDTRSH
jgi:hypothetical protein